MKEKVRWKTKKGNDYSEVNKPTEDAASVLVLPIKNKPTDKRLVCFFSSGGRTRTSDLRVMSPTSCQLLYSAVLLDRKDTAFL